MAPWPWTLPVSPKARKLSSYKKTLGNMVVSIVGAGVLGLPYAFRRSGWAFSILALAAMALVSFYGMLLLLKTRKLLEAESRRQPSGPASKAKEGGAGGPGVLQAAGPSEEAALSDLPTEDPSVRALVHGRKHEEPEEPVEEGEGYFLRITSYGELGNRVMGTFGQVSGPGHEEGKRDLAALQLSTLRCSEGAAFNNRGSPSVNSS